MIAATELQVNGDGKWKKEELGKHSGRLCHKPHKRAENWFSVGVKKKAGDTASVEKEHFHALFFVIVENFATSKIGKLNNLL